MHCFLFYRITLLLLLCSLGYVAQAGPGFAGLQPGAYGVGFRVVQQYDYARSYHEKTDLITGKMQLGERARPVQTLVWYPAPKTGTPVRYADYLRTEATDEVFEQTAPQLAAFMTRREQGMAATVGPKQAQALLDQRMWAVSNAPAMTGKFPVVIYAAGGDGAAHEAADLCEYLASHGYVVLASRSLGTRTKAMNFDADGLDTQARDIRFLLSYAHTLPQADIAHVAAAGWSWGGLANALAASQDSRIAALVSFDGTQYRGDTKRVSRRRLALPWLYVQRRPESVRELSAKGMETTDILLNEAVYTDRYHVVMNPLAHLDFSTSDLRVAPSAHFTEYTRPEVEAAATSRQFLDRSPAQNGVPTHMAQLYHLPAHQGPMPTQAGLAAALAADGFAHARDLYRQAQQQDSTFVLSEEALNTWGYQLLGDAHDLPAALAIFRLGTELYPDSFNLFDSLGEAEELHHNNAAAVTHYQRSVELNPQNNHAKQRLQALSTSSPNTSVK